MLNKTILLTLTIAALFSAALAACPSACSGHGSCGNHDKCSCYMNWEGSDCSAKTCPQGNGLTCSGRGTCDGGAGECACAEGYSGDACQRTLCPNECSGKGSCDTSTGLCSCAGGFGGNDCSSRLCPRGDDPLTHEVENQGDGTVMQQSEVQEITFSAGIGIGGSATLTYSDLYGQSWTTRPINLGDGLHYVLDYALGTALTGAHNDTYAYLALTYGGTKVECGNTHDTNSAALIREKLLGAATIGASTDLAKSIRVTKRPDRTSHKFAGGIEADAKTTYDIYINPHLFDGLNEAGGLKAFTAELQQSGGAASTQVADGKAYVNLRLASDASADIKDALEGLPNNVIPAVTVTKWDYTTPNTNDQATNGNAYHQAYRVTFSSSSNTGDQNMLSCDASPCDHDGCANRKSGAASITYLHHDYTFGAKSSAAAPGAGSTAITQKVPKVNFQGQGYFIIDIHKDASDDASDVAAMATAQNGRFSSGTAYVEWNTGAGVDRAEFPIIATAATVQTSLRGITGWSGVTVTSQCAAVSPCVNLDRAHSYTVTFPSGYDDGGQTPKVAFSEANGGSAGDDSAIIIYDQRFSNSLWLGDITGWHPVTCSEGTAPVTDFCNVGTVNSDATIQGEFGDNYKITVVNFGHLNQFQAQASTLIKTEAKVATFSNIHSATNDFGIGIGALSHDATLAYIMVDNDKAFPTATSQNTGEYFAVGSTIEVLPKTWDRTDRDDDIPDGTVANAYRTFKVLSHVSNIHGQTFAKLDSTPTKSSGANYALKVTTHNSTVTTRTSVTLNAAQGEVQEIWAIASNVDAAHAGDQYRIYINANKPNVEFTEILTGLSTNNQVAEAINSFSALSGPVTVTGAGTGTLDLAKISIAFDAIDGDVPQLTIDKLADGGSSNTMSTETTKQGWSFFAGQSARLENVAPGSVINITASEEVTFTITGWSSGDVVFSYDGTVASAGLTFGATFTSNEVEAAINSIKDAKGLAKFALADNAATDGAATPGKPTSAAIQVTLPKGMDGSKLELFPAASITDATAITKSVAKNNNGKSFKVTRVVNQKFDLNGAGQGTHLATKYINTMNNKAAVVENDELKFTKSGAAICEAQTGAANTDENYNYNAVIYKTITDVAHTVTGTKATSHTKLTFATGIGAVTSACNFEVVRTTIVVDSVPDTLSAASVDLHITSPVGSCTVTEAVKGTYESDVCSSRGSCDGAAGLCTCHEGYSGEACETQTVLV